MLRVLTLNIWFDLKLRAARLEALLQVIHSSDASVCCLQEVVPDVAKALRERLPEWRSSDPGDGSSVEPYGVMILVRPDTLVLSFHFHEFRTEMARRLLVAELEGITIATVHLESLGNHGHRQDQLRVCNCVLDNYADAILLGDFNFDSEKNYSPPHDPLENQALQLIPDFVDVWQVLRQSERGLTFDSKLNTYIGKSEQMRYDRVMAKIRGWRATQIDLIGDKPVDHLVQLSAHEQAWLERPPTPPRPSLRPRDSDLWCVGEADGELAQDVLVQRARVESPPPRKKGLFLSDHFGLLADFVKLPQG